jgi:heat shock protein HslJ
MLNKKLILSIFLLLSLILVACEGVTVRFEDSGGAAPDGAAPDAAATTADSAEPAAPDLIAAPAIMSAPRASLTNFVWQWSDLVETSPASQSVVPNPENYSVTFQDDGSLVIQADCNNGGGTYTRAFDSNSLTIEVGALTRAFCGEESLDNRFLFLLGSVTGYEIADDRLYLTSAENARMGFNNGGPSELAQQVGLLPGQINIDTQGLPYSWQANLVPGTPYDQSQPPGPQGIPGHIEVNFGVVNPSDRQVGDPVMYIIPVATYEQMWLENDNGSVVDAVDAIFGYTVALQQPPPTTMPALPVEQLGGVNDVAVQIDRAGFTSDSASKNGYRFVGRYAQDANPITSDGLPLRYIYQGFTNDANYLVAFFYPVTSDSLPTNTEVSEEWNAAQSQQGGTQAFLDQQMADLNALSASDWEPDLDTLDAVVQSLIITSMPANAVENQSWQLNSDSGSDAAIVGVEAYTLSYLLNGTFTYTTDCNNGSGVYIVNVASGVTGPIAMNPQASTRMACAEGSAHDMFVGTLNASQNFKVHPGIDKSLELVRPAGGGSLVFTWLGSAEEVVPTPTPEPPPTAIPTALPTALPTAVPPTATATAQPLPPTPAIPYGIVSTRDGVNVRSGPGTVYPIVGGLDQGDRLEIVGRSADFLWWATPWGASSTGIGWVSGQYVNAFNVAGIPVLPAPPLPTPVPTATPVPVPPTATPAPQISFTVDNSTINQGECTMLRWSVQNVQALWIYPAGQPFAQYPVPGQGTQQVCPQTTTTYEMRVQNTNGSVDFRQVTVQVVPVNPLANTSWSVGRLNGFGVPIPGTNMTASFGGTGTINVNGGCNTYSGTYSVNGSNITISALIGTQIFCADDISQQETQYLAALQSAVRYELRSGNSILALFNGAGAEVVNFNALVATQY